MTNKPAKKEGKGEQWTSVQQTMMLPKQLYDAACKVALAKGLKVTDIIRIALSDYIYKS